MSAQPQTQQTPFDRDWSNEAHLTEVQLKSRPHYLFVGIDDSAGRVAGGGIDVSRDILYHGLKAIYAGRLTRVENKSWIDPRAVLGEDEGDQVGGGAVSLEPDDARAFQVGKKQKWSYAAEIAGLLWNAHYRTGARVINRLTGVYPAIHKWVEHVLLAPAYGKGVLERRAWLEAFDESKIPAPPSDANWQAWLLMTRTDPVELVMSVRSECLEACATGETYVRQFYDEYVAEMRGALIPGRGGLSFVSSKLRLVSKELGLPVPEELAAEASRVQAQGGTLQLQMPDDLKQMLQAAIGGGQSRGNFADPRLTEEFEAFLAWRRSQGVAQMVSAPPAAGPSVADSDWSNPAAPPAQSPQAAEIDEEAAAIEPERVTDTRTIAEKSAGEEAFNPDGDASTSRPAIPRGEGGRFAPKKRD
jgi:hypothetical protein